MDARKPHWPEQFMTVAHTVTKLCQEEAPAYMRVGNTQRPQVLRYEANPEYHDILTNYKKNTGLSTLVKTSFNMHEEPIVCTAEDAIRAFLKSGVDHLAVGSYIVSHPNSEKAKAAKRS